MTVSTKPQSMDTFSARVRDQGDRLILTLQDAESPVIWQMDRVHVRTAGFDVTAQGDMWCVRFKPMEDDPCDIATYRDRAQAVEVLNEIQQALIRNQNRRGGRTGEEPLRRHHLMLAGVSVLLLVTLIWMLFQLVPAPMAGTAPGSVAQASNLVVPSSGIPQSADDVLQDPETAP